MPAKSSAPPAQRRSSRDVKFRGIASKYVCDLHNYLWSNMLGARFGKLFVKSQLEQRSKDRRLQFLCQCDCGNETTVSGTLLRRGTQSCGCLRIEKISSEAPVTKDPLYTTWLGMKQRCYNINHHKYKDYGGRGIIVDPIWKSSFHQFKIDMGERPEGCTLDRIDNDGIYTKDNCRWSSYKQQANNRRERNAFKVC